MRYGNGAYTHCSDCDDGDARIAACEDTGDTGCELGSETCPAKSCADLLSSKPSAAAGDYWLEQRDGDVVQRLCDMTTDGGGWTRIVAFDAADSSNEDSTFRSDFIQDYDDQDHFSDNGDYLLMCDTDWSGDTARYSLEVQIAAVACSRSSSRR